MSDGPEHLLNVDVLLGGGLEELDVHLLGESLGVLGQDDLAVGRVVLVAHEDFVHDVAVLLDLVEPSVKSNKFIKSNNTWQYKKR